MVVVATWTPSVSTDVVTQEFAWIKNGEVVKTVNLTPVASSRSTFQDGVAVGEGDEICVAIVAKDTVSASDPLTGCVTVPITPPEAPTGLILEIVAPE